jgi:hypothetical protein
VGRTGMLYANNPMMSRKNGTAGPKAAETPCF